MRRILWLLIVSLAGLVLASAQNNSAAAHTKELLQIENDLMNAYVHRDLSVRDRYVADEFVGVDSSGNVYSKQQDMQELKDGTFTMKSFRTEGVEVRLFGDSALVTGRNTATSVYKGKEQTDTIRYVDTFLKRDGRWQMVYSQDTNVANTTASTNEPDDAVLKAIAASDENQIIALEKRLWNGDANVILKLEAEDYEVIKHAHRYHRADDEAAAKDAKFALTSMDDIRVRMLRPDVALITYHATQKGSFRGTEMPPSLYFGSIWVNRNGDWKNVFLEENAPDVFTDIYRPGASSDRAQPEDPRATSSQTLPDDDLSGNSGVYLPTRKDAAQTVPGPSANTTLVNLDAHTKLAPFEEMIIGKEKEAIEAVEKNDLKHFATLIADDFLMIADDGLWAKREYLKSFEEDVAWEDCKMEDIRVSSSGENSAIISYKQTWTGRDHGKRFETVIYTHGHWEKRKGQWVVTLWQDTTAENSSTPADEAKPRLTLPPSPGRSNLQTEVLSREHSFMEALKRNDCPTVSAFMADGLVAIGVNGIQGKAEYVKLCETRQKQWTDFEVEQVQVYPLRANSAVLVKKVVLSGTDHGKQSRSVELWHEDWERLNGDWKITGLQYTRTK